MGSGSTLPHSPVPVPVPLQLLQLLPVLEDSTDELGEEPLHVAARAGAEPLQEAEVAPMGRHQQRHVGQVPGGFHGDGWASMAEGG